MHENSRPARAGHGTLPGRLSLRAPARLAATAALVAVSAAGCASSAGSGTSAPGTSAGARGAAGAAATPAAYAALQGAFTAAIKEVLPSVVEIRTSSGLGSGVVFDSGGDIVTNAHVVGSATSMQVLGSGSAEPVPATLVGVYRPDDLAVIRVSDAKGLRPAVFGNSSVLAAGDIVLAIGNPLGLDSSVTEGIVSAVGRIVSEPTSDGAAGATLPDTIQTSAAINPGNSGGALATLDGEVVGIPTLAAVGQTGGAAPGIGFAIPSSIAIDIARQLAATGHVTNPHRAALGVSAVTVTGADGTPAGVSVAALTAGGPAAAAGIAVGDVITAVDGKATPDAQALATVLAGLGPGQGVSVAVTRASGGTGDVRVTLGELPGS
jgi:putative serine protease PepD